MLYINPDMVFKQTDCNTVKALNITTGEQFELGTHEYNTLIMCYSHNAHKNYNAKMQLSEERILINSGILIDENQYMNHSRFIVKPKIESISKIKLMTYTISGRTKLQNSFLARANIIRITVLLLSIIGVVCFLFSFFDIIRYESNKNRVVDILESFELKGCLFIFLCFLLMSSVHELSHLLTYRLFCDYPCKIGIMLFFLAPTLYCELTGMYLLTKKERYIVLLSGSLSQLIVGSIISIINYYVSYGKTSEAHIYCVVFLMLNYTSIAINFFPLIKLDGYWILSTFLEVNNLMKKSHLYIIGVLNRFDMNVTTKQKKIYWIFGMLSFFAHFLIWMFIGLNILFLIPISKILSALTLVMYIVIMILYIIRKYNQYKQTLDKKDVI